MNKKLALSLMLGISSFSYADSSSDPLQDQLKTEYGTCYDTFTMNLGNCAPSSCAYPDLSDAKAWKAQTINGYVNGKNGLCYVMYYSFVGQQVTSNPDHCFYDAKQLKNLTDLYRKLFTKGATTIDILSTKDQIHYLEMQNCKKQDEDKKQ